MGAAFAPGGDEFDLRLEVLQALFEKLLDLKVDAFGVGLEPGGGFENRHLHGHGQAR